MLVLKPRKVKKRLVMGDYVTVHMMGEAGSQTHTGSKHDNLVSHDEFFQRSLKERGLLKANRDQRDIVMNVDNRQRGLLQNSLPRRRAG
jgi:hypothetical protein